MRSGDWLQGNLGQPHSALGKGACVEDMGSTSNL